MSGGLPGYSVVALPLFVDLNVVLCRSLETLLWLKKVSVDISADSCLCPSRVTEDAETRPSSAGTQPPARLSTMLMTKVMSIVRPRNAASAPERLPSEFRGVAGT